MTDDLPCGCASMCGTCRGELARFGLPAPPEPAPRASSLRAWLRRHTILTKHIREEVNNMETQEPTPPETPETPPAEETPQGSTQDPKPGDDE